VIDPRQFINFRLRGGFIISEIEFTREPLLDALGREAAAQTHIVGREFRLLIRSGLDQQELSITLYHEILEAASVGSLNPPADIMDFNEGAFEQAARAAHARWGTASSENLNLLLQFYGFAEQ
jgi:hypothetical protein